MKKYDYQRSILIILDGFGISNVPNDKSNAIALAHTPNFDNLYKKFPCSQLETSGKSVGLQNGQMGNSEIGHMNIGSGRIIYTDIENINKEFKNNNVQNLSGFQKFYQEKKNNRIHLFIMLSDGGVHSHIKHLFFLLNVFEKTLSNQKIYIHAFLDGRDTPPNSAGKYISFLQEEIKNKYISNSVFLSTIIGRFYAMDRNKNWDRTQKAYDVLVNGIGKSKKIENLDTYIQECYNQKIYDEFMEPVCIHREGCLQDNDSVFFLNFRADRARQITQSICDRNFDHFGILNRPKLAQFISFTEYDKSFSIPFIFSSQEYSNTLGEIISNFGKKQVRIAETEKYAHVTYFFNCGKETPYKGEERILVPSPKVKTYDKKPEMSAYQVKNSIDLAIEDETNTLIVANFANGDMVGHTGNLEASIKAVEILDECIGDIVQKVLEKENIFVCITADHGNCEKMLDSNGLPFTQHTTFPVPFILVSQNFINKKIQLRNGILADISPTILHLLGLDVQIDTSFDKKRLGNLLIENL